MSHLMAQTQTQTPTPPESPQEQILTPASMTGNSHPHLQVSREADLPVIFPPGEITPIAIWRINSVTYGNFRFICSVLAVLELGMRAALLSLHSCNIHFG